MKIVCLLNGSTNVRERASEGVTVLGCGCAHLPTHWLQACREHNEESEAFHVQARADHAREAAIQELIS
jgi:hypothetical protein